MVIKYVISPYPALTENMVVKVYEAQAPAAEVYSQVLVAPHTAPRTITINGLDRVAHIVRLFTATSANLLHDYNVEPVTDIATVFDPIRFKIGDGVALTPVADTITYANPLLVGLQANEYSVFRNNYGVLFPVTHYTVDITNGAFSLLPGDGFNIDEEFTVQRQTKVLSSIVNDSVVAKIFGGFIDVAANVSYTPAHLRKAIRFTANAFYEFPFLAAIPIGYSHTFINQAALTVTGNIVFANAALLYGGSSVGGIEIKSGFEACFTFDGTFWNVVYITDSKIITQTTSEVNKIIYSGEHNVGDVAGGDPVYVIVHNKNIVGDYMVMFSLRTTNPAVYFRNNLVCGTWYHHATDKPNRFNVSLQEVASEGQSLAISYIIIKL